MYAVKIIVRGRVQGVAFRYYTRKKAVELGITGTVENQVDGSVRIHASGENTVVKEFIRWCHHGSPASRVDRVEVVVDLTGAEHLDFRILR